MTIDGGANSVSSKQCDCPLLAKLDSYFAGFVEVNLGINRHSCEGPIKTEIGDLVCRAYQNRLEEWARVTESPHMAAERILREENDKA